jgi:protein involved in polysaccharide export with SLBB domain
VIDLDLRAMRASGRSGDIRVQPYDVLVIKEVPDWREQESVVVRGEVRFPGTYPIRRGETLSSLITRAGGLTESAFPAGSVSSCARRSRCRSASRSRRSRTGCSPILR